MAATGSRFRFSPYAVFSCGTIPKQTSGLYPADDEGLFARFQIPNQIMNTPTLSQRSGALCLLAATLLFAASHLAIAGTRPRFQVAELAGVPGGIAYAINDRGDIVGSSG